MATYVTPKKNVEFIFYVALPSRADSNVLQVDPTLAAGDVKVSTDGAATGNITTLPATTPAGTCMVKVTLSAAEMNGDNIQVQFKDAAGDQWADLLINIQTTARQVDDLAYPATSGRSTLVNTTGGVAPDWGQVQNPTTALNLSGTNIDVDQIVASVSGAVGSVTGAVGSVTGNVTGSIGSLATQAKADVNAEVVDAVNVDTYGEATGVPAFPNSLVAMVRRIFTTQVNPLATTATAKTLKNAAGTAQWKKVVADDGTTYTEGGGVAP